MLFKHPTLEMAMQNAIKELKDQYTDISIENHHESIAQCNGTVIYGTCFINGKKGYFALRVKRDEMKHPNRQYIPTLQVRHEPFTYF